MRFILTYIILLTALLYNPSKAHAIIILPALILIPIAQIIASIIAFLSVPLAAFTLLFRKYLKKSRNKTFAFFLIATLVIIIAIAIILKIINPDRPWF